MTTQRILTLLTDFGERDIYVGVMKGVIAQINPSLTVIDLTHQIPPQNVIAARFNLMSAYAYFPPATVHIAVVDPGVGSQRRAIAIQLENGFLVGPDNGIFSGVLATDSAIAVVVLDNPIYWRNSTPSATFHGRDIFAPIGAHLASGVPLEELGSPLPVTDLIEASLPACTHENGRIVGVIQYIDHFGNLVTNIPGRDVAGKPWWIELGAYQIPGQQTYIDAAIGSEVALVGSHGWLEIAINGGNAQVQLQAIVGTPVRVHVNSD